MRNSLKTFLHCAATILLALSVPAQVTIDFSGDLATAGLTLGNASQAVYSPSAGSYSSLVSRKAYSPDTALLNTSLLPSYTGPAMYGGFYQESLYDSVQSEAAQATWFSLGNVASPGNDYLRMRRNGPATTRNVRRALLLFDAGGVFALDAQSRMDLGLAMGAGTGTGHWMVLHDGTLYRSATAIPLQSASTAYALTTTVSSKWQPVTVTADLELSDAGAAVSGSTLKGITQAGIHWERPTGNTSNLNSDLTLFQARLSADIFDLAGPTDLRVTAAGLTQLSLAWNDLADGEESYELERSPNGISDWTLRATLPPNSSTHTDSGLTESTPYFYRVRAVAAAGRSPYSNVLQATTAGTVPEGAGGLTATASSGIRVRLDWIDNASAETGFRVERQTPDSPWQALGAAPANAVQFVDVSVVPDTTYSYRVFAISPAGDSEPSNTATATTPANFNVNFLIFGNSYSRFFDHLPSLAASTGDTFSFVPMRNGGEVHIQLQAEQDEEDGLRILPATSTKFTDGFSPLETNYSQYVRMKDVLDEREWDAISYQPHSSWANKFSEIQIRANGVHAYFSQPHHEPSAQVFFYHTTQYRNDEHLFRNLVNGNAHRDTLRGTLPYTQDQHVFDALLASRQVHSTYGWPVSPGGLAQMNLIYDARWGFRYPDYAFDYFDNSLNPAKPLEIPERRLHFGFRWATASNPTLYNWSIDSHPHVLLNYLTACVWYEKLFRKDVRLATYGPAGISAETSSLIRDVAHRSALGELPPLRLTDAPSRLAYADILWERANALLADPRADAQAAGLQNLVHLRAYFPEHPRAADAAALLDSAGRLEETLALAAREATERPVREDIHQRIWDASTAGKPVTITLGPLADPDGDGNATLLEQHLRLDPQAPDPEFPGSLRWSPEVAASPLTLTHRRSTLPLSGTLLLERSFDLSANDWTLLTPGTDYLTEVIDPDPDGTGLGEEVRHRILWPESQPIGFLRFRLQP